MNIEFLLNSLFAEILTRGIKVTLVIPIIFAIRWILRKAPKWNRLFLWAIVALYLIMPIRIHAPFSFGHLIPESGRIIFDNRAYQTEKPQLAIGMPEMTGQSDMGSISSGSSLGDWNQLIAGVFPDAEDGLHDGEMLQAAEHEGNQQPEYNQQSGIDQQSGGQQLQNGRIHFSKIMLPDYCKIWLAMIAGLLWYAAWQFLELQKKLSESVPYSRDIRICEQIQSPFIFGWLHPVIYIPSGLGEKELDCVISHERSHLKHGDVWWKLIGFAVLIVYWFQPLAWISYTAFCKDLELACDERVIAGCDLEHKKAYSRALLNCSIQKQAVLVFPLAFGEIGLKERIKAVLGYKKPAIGFVCLSLFICLVTACGFLTSADYENNIDSTEKVSSGIADGTLQSDKEDSMNIENSSGEAGASGTVNSSGEAGTSSTVNSSGAADSSNVADLSGAFGEFATTSTWKPEQPVRIIVPDEEGSINGKVAELFCKYACALTKADFQVVYAPSSAPAATERVLQAEPDGYTLLLDGSTIILNQLTYQMADGMYEDSSNDIWGPAFAVTKGQIFEEQISENRIQQLEKAGIPYYIPDQVFSLHLPAMANSNIRLYMEDLTKTLTENKEVQKELQSLGAKTFYQSAKDSAVRELDDMRMIKLILNGDESDLSRVVLNQFFEAFSGEDYDTMKSLCTEAMNDYFTETDTGETYFFGMKNGNLVECTGILMEEYVRSLFPDSTGECYVFEVILNGTSAPAAYSALGDSEYLEDVSYYVQMIPVDGKYMINALTTG